MIFAHHGGEQAVIGALAAGGTTVVSGLVLFGRAKLATTLRWLLRR